LHSLLKEERKSFQNVPNFAAAPFFALSFPDVKKLHQEFRFVGRHRRLDVKVKTESKFAHEKVFRPQKRD
jgi:hypothetical protein